MKKRWIQSITAILLICMVGGSVMGASQVPGTQTTPGSYQVEKKRPFMLDNFKVIEATLKGFGVDQNELRAYIGQGKKLEDVLKIEKISLKKFKKQVVKEYFKVVDEGVANKQLTEEQAKQLRKAITETVKGWLPKK